MNSMLSFQEFSQTESQPTEKASVSRNKVKPWVFRPKKVIYSLEDSQTTTRKQYSKSHWSEDENEKYVSFLIKFKSVIEGGKKNRRKWHLNRMMSKAIGTRSHEQCRSHHQKMIKHYKTVEGILSHLSKADLQIPTSSGNGDSSQMDLLKMQSSGDGYQDSIMKLLDLEGDCSMGIELPFFFTEQPLI